MNEKFCVEKYRGILSVNEGVKIADIFKLKGGSLQAVNVDAKWELHRPSGPTGWCAFDWNCQFHQDTSVTLREYDGQGRKAGATSANIVTRRSESCGSRDTGQWKHRFIDQQRGAANQIECMSFEGWCNFIAGEPGL